MLHPRVLAGRSLRRRRAHRGRRPGRDPNRAHPAHFSARPTVRAEGLPADAVGSYNWAVTRKIEQLRVVYEWQRPTPSFRIDYTPISDQGPISHLAGRVTIGSGGDEPLSKTPRSILQRAAALAETFQTFLRREEELEIRGQVVQVPLEVTQFTVVPHENKVDTRVSGPGFSTERFVALDALSQGGRRLVQSMTTTVERVAWEDFRGRLEIPAKEKGLEVFISYRKPHEQFAESLAQRLGAEGIVPWFDKWDVLAGDSLPGKIEQGLEESTAFIPIITADYQRGTWATEELQSAIAKRVETDFRIVPVLLEECERPELIRHLRYVDFTAQDPETFESKVGEMIDAIYGLTLNPFR